SSATSRQDSAGRDRQRLSSLTTSRLLALWLWQARQKAASPPSRRPPGATTTAAPLSLTNNPGLPSPRHPAVEVGVVRLLAVPGGPSSTRLAPRVTADFSPERPLPDLCTKIPPTFETPTHDDRGAEEVRHLRPGRWYTRRQSS